jgi:hypothetical protein
VFANIGFAADSDDVTIDYSKACAKVFTDFTMHTANRHGLVAMLELVSDLEAQPRLQGLPYFVSDLSKSLSPALRFPIRTRRPTNGPGPWKLWGQNPVFVMKLPQKVIGLTSCELLLGQIPPPIHNTITSKLANIDYTTHSYYLKMKSKDVPILRAIWNQVARVWGGIMDDNDILQLELLGAFPSSDIGDSLLQPSGCYLTEYTIPLYVVLSFDTRYSSNYLHGRALAKSDRGKFALVPAASQQGDLVAHVVSDSLHSRQVSLKSCFYIKTQF